MTHVAFQTHEFEANYIYTEHGRQPYFAIGRLIDVAGGAGEWKIEFAGDEWIVKLSFNPDTGLKPRRDDDIPSDTPMHEYWLKCRSADAEDHRKATFNISPRWDGQLSMCGDELGTPFDHDRVHVADGEVDMPDSGVNVAADTSNIDASVVPGLFGHMVYAIADEVNTNLRNGLFDEFHPISNIQALEGYVRHRRSKQSQLVQQDGALWRIFHLLGDQQGNVVEYMADNNEIEGHLHKVKMSKGDPGQLVPGHELNKQYKSYHPKNVRADESDPLYHPKFGVLVHAAWQDGTLYVSQLNEIEREIEEAGVNVMGWAGIDVNADRGPWVPDHHFEPIGSFENIERVEDPTPQIKAQQESQLMRVVHDASPAESEIMADVAANDGSKHYTLLDRSSSAVYRALDQFEDVLQSDNGIIEFASKKLEEDIHEMLNVADRVHSRMAESLSRMLGINSDFLDAAEGELERFMKKYAIDIRDTGEGQVVADVGVPLTKLRSMYDDTPQVAVVIGKLKRLMRMSPRMESIPYIKIKYQTMIGGERVETIGEPRFAPRA